MRIFVALDIPDIVKDNLFGIQKYIPSNLAKIKWVSKKNLHITLKFLGNVDLSKLEEVKTRLTNVKFDSSNLRFKDIGFFNKEGKPSIIRLDFYNNKTVEELYKRIDEALLDLFPANQTFTLHAILGRIKNIKKEKELLDKINSFELFKEEFKVEGFNLMHSVPVKGTHSYKLVENFKS